jgi:hypothetical protein
LRLLIIQDHKDRPDFKITWLQEVQEERKGTSDKDVEDLKESGNIGADDDLFTGTAAAQLVLNQARQKLGAHSDSDSSFDGD